MKLKTNVIFNLFLFVIVTFGHSQQKVIIKGTQTIISSDFMNKMENDFNQKLGKILYDNDDVDKRHEKKVQHFTISYSYNIMKMKAELIKYDVILHTKEEEEEIGRNNVVMELIFSASGNPIMNIFMEEVVKKVNKEKKVMTLIATTELPKKDSFTVSDALINLMQSGGTSGELWNGYSTVEYVYTGKTLTDTHVNDSDEDKNDNMVKIKRHSASSLQLAQGVNGVEIMDEFYGRLLEGGYDIGGSDEGSILSSIGYLLSEGMPVHIVERIHYYLDSQHESESLTFYSSETEIFSVETSDAEISLISKVSSNKDEATSAKSQEEEPEGCDFSCEKYKQLMAMGKKKKKDMDPSKMQKIDMSCIQECAKQWANCAKN